MEIGNHDVIMKERGDHIWEEWIRAMEVKVVRLELERCQRVEGVNAGEECKWLRDKYLKFMQTNKVKGYKTVDHK